MGGSDCVRLCPGGGGGGLFFDRVELPQAGVCAEGGRFNKGGAGGKTNIKQEHAVISWGRMDTVIKHGSVEDTGRRVTGQKVK